MDKEQVDRVRLGERIKEAREYLGYSQDEVGAVLGFSRSGVSLMESGNRKIEVLELQKLAKLFERPMSFFTDEPDKASKADKQIAALARMAGTLAAGDIEELRKFADYLQARAQAKAEKKNG